MIIHPTILKIKYVKLNCYICREILDKPSALLFGPPEGFTNEVNDQIDYDDKVKKYHICVNCYDNTMAFMNVRKEILRDK